LTVKAFIIHGALVYAVSRVLRRVGGQGDGQGYRDREGEGVRERERGNVSE
jgi:hypothetical protein